MEITIKLKVKNVEMELSAQEARDLAEALRAIIAQPAVVPLVVPYVQPDWTWRPWESPWYVTRGGTNMPIGDRLALSVS